MIVATPWTYLIGTLLAAASGAILPLIRQWSERQLHLFIALSAGIFLGAAFLHILPEIAEDGFDNTMGIMTLAGFASILLIERVLLAQHERACGMICSHEHAVVGYAAFIGLSAHSIADGLSLGLGLSDPKLGMAIFIAVIAHKSIDAFSLATVFRLALFPPRRMLILLGLFCLSTPLSALVTLSAMNGFSPFSVKAPIAFAAGTFLYVATCDLLPEAFHENHGRIGSFVALLTGIISMLVITLIEP